MKVRIIKDYNDLELKRLVTVKKDKELTVSDERGKVLIEAGVAEEIKKAKTPAPEKKPEEKPEDKPEEKPEDKPEEKPEDKPEEKPEEKPEPEKNNKKDKEA